MGNNRSNKVRDRIDSPGRKSGLPVPKSVNVPTANGAKKCSSEAALSHVVLRAKVRPLGNSSNFRNSLKSSPANSPRNSLYKEALVMQQRATGDASLNCKKSGNSDMKSNSSKVVNENACCSTPAKNVTKHPNVNHSNVGNSSPNVRVKSHRRNSRELSKSPTVVVKSTAAAARSSSSSKAHDHELKPVLPPKPDIQSSPVVKSQHFGSSGNIRSRIPTSPPANTTTNLPQESKTPAKSKLAVSNNRKPNTDSPKSGRTNLKSGRIPSYLNKSTPSLASNTVSRIPNNISSSKTTTRPLSRDFDLTPGASNYHTTLKEPKTLRPLAPTAKFRSDGEISICESLSNSPTSPLVHNNERNEVTPTRVTTTKKADKLRSSSPCNVQPHRRPPGRSAAFSSCNSNDILAKNSSASVLKNSPKVSVTPRVLSCDRLRQKNLCKGEATQQEKNINNNNRSSRLSSEVQCWPWTTPTSSTSCGSAVKIRDSSSSLRKNVQTEIGKCAAPVTRRNEEQIELRTCSSRNVVSVENKKNFFKVRSKSLTFFQRLGGLRRSLSQRSSQSSGRKTLLRNRPVFPENSNDQDHVFFRGFSGKRREDLLEPYVIIHGPILTIPSSHPTPPSSPLRRHRPRRYLEVEDSIFVPLRRALSLSDAHFIAQAMYEGDMRLIEDNYPDFPRSSPIYEVIDPAKNRTLRQQQRQSHPSSSKNRGSFTKTLSPSSAIHTNNEKRRSRPVVADISNCHPGSGSRAIDGQLDSANRKTAAYSSTVVKNTNGSAVEYRKFSPRANNNNNRDAGANAGFLLQGGETGNTSSNNRLQDSVTFSSPVMFVKQASDLQKRRGKIFIITPI